MSTALNELVGGLTEGVTTNRPLVEELGDAIADKLVNKLLTSLPSRGCNPKILKVRAGDGL